MNHPAVKTAPHRLGLAWHRESSGAHVESPTSIVQAMCLEMGVPFNLFDLEQGDMSGYEKMEFFYLELEHKLKAFYPAVVKMTGQVVVTVSLDPLERVWRSITPRTSKVVRGLGYFHQELGIVYPIVGVDDHEKQTSTPCRVLSGEEVDELLTNQRFPFGWALGLVNGFISLQEYEAIIKKNIRPGR